jgi:hypothetical protein
MEWDKLDETLPARIAACRALQFQCPMSMNKEVGIADTRQEFSTS